MDIISERFRASRWDRRALTETRLLELFFDREVFDALRAEGRPSDWYHFEPKTYDGQYLVETPDASRSMRKIAGQE